MVQYHLRTASAQADALLCQLLNTLFLASENRDKPEYTYYGVRHHLKVRDSQLALSAEAWEGWFLVCNSAWHCWFLKK